MSDKLSKYHDEKAGSTSGGPADSENSDTLPSIHGSQPSVLVPENMGNPMMQMSGGKMGDTHNSENPMMPMSGNHSSELPSEGQVMAKNPQGKKSAPLASKLMSARAAHIAAAKK